MSDTRGYWDGCPDTEWEIPALGLSGVTVPGFGRVGEPGEPFSGCCGIWKEDSPTGMPIGDWRFIDAEWDDDGNVTRVIMEIDNAETE